MSTLFGEIKRTPFIEEGKSYILILEDERIVALDLKVRLRALGFEVLAANSGEDALLWLEKAAELPSAMVFDVCLGSGIDGVETARRAKADCDAPIIFHTSLSIDALYDKAVDIKGWTYVPKSGTHGLLEREVCRVMAPAKVS